MNKVRLRALTNSDTEKTLSWHNQEDISDLYSGHPFPINIEMEQKWYEKILYSNFPVTIFGIEYIENNILIGITMLKDINMINRSAEFAIYIGNKEYRGKGLSKEASIVTLKFGFKKLGLKRISLKVIEKNETAINLYKTIGFSQEGLLRNSVYKNGKFLNEIAFSILSFEFDKKYRD